MTLGLLRLLPVLGCLLGAGMVSADELTARLAGEPFILEVADDAQSRRQGLMGRNELPAGTGMLFDFPPGITPVIWMRNMHIPLDLVYLNEQAQITHLFEGVPPCESMPCALYRADRPLRFVIEVPAGTIEQLDLQVGQSVDISGREDQPSPRD